MTYSFLASLFIAAPMSVLPLLETNSRLDLIDLFEAGMDATIGNRYKGTSELVAFSDSLISLRLTGVSTMDMRLTADSLLEIRQCYILPEDTMTTCAYYDRNWKRIKTTKHK